MMIVSRILATGSSAGATVVGIGSDTTASSMGVGAVTPSPRSAVARARRRRPQSMQRRSREAATTRHRLLSRPSAVNTSTHGMPGGAARSGSVAWRTRTSTTAANASLASSRATSAIRSAERRRSTAIVTNGGRLRRRPRLQSTQGSYKGKRGFDAMASPMRSRARWCLARRCCSLSPCPLNPERCAKWAWRTAPIRRSRGSEHPGQLWPTREAVSAADQRSRWVEREGDQQLPHLPSGLRHHPSSPSSVTTGNTPPSRR